MLADRQQIEDVLIAYTHALDEGDWAALEQCFTPDATTHYGKFGGGNANRDEILDTCRTAMAPIESSQHLISNLVIRIDGDEATVVCYLNALNMTKDTPGGDDCTVYGVYRDRLVRTPDGWRISRRELDISWVEGNPAVMRGATEAAAARDPQ